MTFKHFAGLVEHQFNQMAKNQLYVVNKTPDEMWDHYMTSFPEGTNELYRERREYDCSTCKSFIRRIGNVVAVKDGKLISIWDVEPESYYKDVTNAMSAFVKSSTINTLFISKETKAGNLANNELLDTGSVKTWNHFHCEVPREMVKADKAGYLGKINGNKQVFERGLNELTLESLEITLELIEANSLYRGEEHKQSISSFLKMKKAYTKLKTDNAKQIYIWTNIKTQGSRIRNSAIGTLLQDLSEGVELTKAVKSFEDKVSGTNYKRPTALVTEGMKKNAIKTIKKLGIEESLHRRYAHIGDISVNDILFVDKSTTPLMKDSLEAILSTTVTKPSNKNFDKVEEMNITDFIKTVLPKSESLEVMFENKHTSNLVSLIAPSSPDAPNILKWDNNFSLSYIGDVADSMKQRVKAAGGYTEGVLRFSIQWNEDMNDKSNDLDAHCKCPEGHIYYNSKKGRLDVDITNPSDKIAVENITWKKKSDIKDGTYEFYVNNFSGRNTGGFRAQIEMEGKVYDFNYPTAVTSDVVVAVVKVRGGKFTIDQRLDSTESIKEEWGINTGSFQKVNTIMYSPNHWEANKTQEGNKHYMFMLEDCVNPDSTRGLYNEFLSPKLTEHRKVFEVLGSKLKCEPDDNQLSGLGFSSTQRNDLIVKVSGTFNRTLRIKF